MATYPTTLCTLNDGTTVELFSPAEEQAGELLEYLDAVRRETRFVMYGPDDTLPTLDQEKGWVRGHLDSAGAVNIAARVRDVVRAEDEPFRGRIVALSGVGSGRLNRVKHKGEIGISALAHWCGRGVGTLLMQRLIDWGTQHPVITLLMLSVFAGNARAIRVYEKVGFERHDIHPREVRFEDGSYGDVLYMSRWVGP